MRVRVIEKNGALDGVRTIVTLVPERGPDFLKHDSVSPIHIYVTVLRGSLKRHGVPEPLENRRITASEALPLRPDGPASHSA
jgi:hypothetical protein